MARFARRARSRRPIVPLRGFGFGLGSGFVLALAPVAPQELREYPLPPGTRPHDVAPALDGGVWFASLAGSYLGRIDRASGAVGVLEPPTPGQGARRVWSDSGGRLWIAEWNAGQVARYDPADGSWREWRLPGDAPQACAVWVDERDRVRQLLGRPGEVWGAGSRVDTLTVVRTGEP